MANFDSVDILSRTRALLNRPSTDEAAGSFKISVRNNTAGSLSEAIVLRFAVVKAVVS